MTDLLELAERVEQATGPDRELGAEIYVAVGHPQAPFAMARGGGVSGLASDPTASLDAAMSLVPEGWLRRMHECFPDGELWWGLTRKETGWLKGVLYGHAATPALALTAAALRARAAAARTGGDAKQAPAESPHSGPPQEGNAQ